MKKIFLIGLAVWIETVSAWASYSTPNTGVSWTMDDLVANSGGKVTGSALNYALHDDIWIEQNDTLTIAAGTTITRDDGGTWPHLLIPGKLIAQGTEANPILITSVTGRGASGDYDRCLEFHATASSNSVINYVIAEHADIGIFITESSGLIFSNCTVRNCNQGFYLSQSTVTISGGEVHGNGASKGAGIYAHQGSPIIENCYIHDNETTTATGNNYGGGICFLDVSSARISGCELNGNHAQWGGGLFVQDSSDIKISRCYFSGGNWQVDYELDHNGAAFQVESSTGIIVEGCRIRNQAFFWQSTGQLINNVIGSFGTTDSSPLIAHNANISSLIFYGNSDPVVANNVFGSGAFIQEIDASADPQLINNIFEPQLRDVEGEGFYQDEFNVWLTTVESLNGLSGNNGNLVTNTFFNLPFYLSSDAMTGWALSSNSPAIDAAVDIGVNVDFIKTTRPLDGNANSNAVHDIGPVEYASFFVDEDTDGISDGDEVKSGLNPLISNVGSDIDGDGLLDIDEVNSHGTNPLKADSDNDGLTDEQEINTYGTNPLNADGDGDGLSDGDEIQMYNTNPSNQDSDTDDLSDGMEVITCGTNPLSADTDDDGISDPDELNAGLNPLISNAGADSDSDGLDDPSEVNIYGLNPLDNDCDDDGLLDGSEINSHGTDPLDEDTDHDALSDGSEINTYGTNPLSNDTDGDSISDWTEINTLGSDPLDPLSPAGVQFVNVTAVQLPGTKQLHIEYDMFSSETNAVEIAIVISNGVDVLEISSVSGDFGKISSLELVKRLFGMLVPTGMPGCPQI